MHERNHDNDDKQIAQPHFVSYIFEQMKSKLIDNETNE